MTRGFIFVVILSMFYWAYIYLSPALKKEANSAPSGADSRTIHDANRHLIESGIEIFRLHEKRSPSVLSELVSNDYLDEIPDSGGIEWRYDPVSGNIR